MLTREIISIVFWRTSEALLELSTLLFIVWALPGTLAWFFETSYSLSPVLENLGATVFGEGSAAALFKQVLHEGTFAFGYLIGTFGIIVASIVVRVFVALTK